MAWINRLSGLLGGKDVECNIVLTGVGDSGKSTVMQQLKPGHIQMIHITPSLPLGFHAEKFKVRGLTLVAFDLGDLTGFGNPWEDFYRDCHAIIFIIDSSDRFNMPQVKGQLEKMLNNPLVVERKVPLLFLANKMDQPGALPSYQLREFLELNMIQSHPWSMVSSDALTGEGLHEGFDWLAHQLRKVCKRKVESCVPTISVTNWT